MVQFSVSETCWPDYISDIILQMLDLVLGLLVDRFLHISRCLVPNQIWCPILNEYDEHSSACPWDFRGPDHASNLKSCTFFFKDQSEWCCFFTVCLVVMDLEVFWSVILWYVDLAGLCNCNRTEAFRASYCEFYIAGLLNNHRSFWCFRLILKCDVPLYYIS